MTGPSDDHTHAMTTPLRERRYRESERAMWEHYGMQPIERWVEVDELDIRVRALEYGKGRPVLFVHGTPTAGGVFVPLVSELSGVRAIVVDRPGCALSDPLDFTGLTPVRLRELDEAWMVPVIDAAANGPIDVVANSAGGLAALVLAARRPELVRSLALLGAPAAQGMKLPAGMRLTTFAPVARVVAHHQVNERDLRRSFKAMGHGDVMASGGVSQADLDWRYSLSRDTDTYANELELLRYAASWRGTRPEWVVSTEEIESLVPPTLWVAGEHDPFATPERMRSWASHARGSTFKVMEGTGHLPWIGHAPAHAGLLEDWWASIGIRAV